jgi:hypothetical protein
MSCATEYFGPSFVVNIAPRQPIQRDNTMILTFVSTMDIQWTSEGGRTTLP